MVSISRLTGMATKAFSTVSKMPTAGKLGLAGLFGAGMLAGSLMTGDGFEKEQKAPEQPKTEVKADTTTVTKPKAEVKEEKEEKFEYNPPQIGKFGVAKADTIYANDGTDKMDCIVYRNDKGEPVHQTDFNKDGSLKQYFITNPKVPEEFRLYNSKGELVEFREKTPDGNIEINKKDKGDAWTTDIFDSKGRRLQSEYRIKNYAISHDDVEYFNTYRYTYTYKPDGSVVENEYRNGTLISQETRDKNDKLLKEKKYDEDEKLEYTVVPKYNKEGDIIKRDTLRNE